jgi:hypothetical protein
MKIKKIAIIIASGILFGIACVILIGVLVVLHESREVERIDQYNLPSWLTNISYVTDINVSPNVGEVCIWDAYSTSSNYKYLHNKIGAAFSSIPQVGTDRIVWIAESRSGEWKIFNTSGLNPNSKSGIQIDTIYLKLSNGAVQTCMERNQGDIILELTNGRVLNFPFD